MKNGIIIILNKLLDIFKFKSKSGEKSQDIEDRKLTEFKPYIAYITMILLVMCIIGIIFPTLSSDWIYAMFEKGWEYILGN
ncbi:MAG: hypothetical protein HUJ87_15040 [Fusobacterium varium]|uniref:hypothetical protein n=1 Tax=Fusobacterium varium TaxID=856 RepID=UPI00242C88A8|nr:hypothetical protein [Fusobacterium varium]MCF0171808.1 hypothetical protein [Fusobacterium varium]